MTMLLVVDWGYILNTALIGFLLVVSVLTLMVLLMALMGCGFSGQKQKKQQPAQQSAEPENEVAAAITAALKIYTSNLHDKESEVITIHKIKSVYSPWSSKIHGLTQLPDYKRK